MIDLIKWKIKNSLPTVTSNSDYKNCNLLEKIKHFHPIEDKLGLISEYVPEKWI